jgi:hypothetical protein
MNAGAIEIHPFTDSDWDCYAGAETPAWIGQISVEGVEATVVMDKTRLTIHDENGDGWFLSVPFLAGKFILSKMNPQTSAAELEAIGFVPIGAMVPEVIS